MIFRARAFKCLLATIACGLLTGSGQSSLAAPPAKQAAAARQASYYSEYARNGGGDSSAHYAIAQNEPAPVADDAAADAAADGAARPAPPAGSQAVISDDQGDLLPDDSLVADGYCSTCGGNAFGCCCQCGPPGRLWVRADYLMWWTHGQGLPALVTQGSLNDRVPGALGQPGTTVLFGNQRVGNDLRSGGRISGGYWFDCCQKCGIIGDYFGLGQQASTYTSPDCGPGQVIARPFTDVNPAFPGPSRELVCQDGVVLGNVSVSTTNNFQGAGAAFRRNICCLRCDDACGLDACTDPCNIGHCRRIDVIAGYRFYRMDDSVIIREALTSTNPGGGIPVGTSFTINDVFSTVNRFNGGEIGLLGEWYKGRWSAELIGRVALGNNQQTVTINGTTTLNVPGQPPAVTSPGGIYALPTNSGVFTRNEFVAIPQINANLGYQITCRLRGFVGYNALYWGSVARAGNVIDTTLNSSQIGGGTLQGPARPAFAFHDSTFWAQGLNFGFELRF